MKRVRRRHVNALSVLLSGLVPGLLLGAIGCAGRESTAIRTATDAEPNSPAVGAPRVVHVAGDSTAAEFPASDGRVGWAAVLESELSGVRVDDAAKSGRSSKSFRDEGHWAALAARIAPGDLVLIQFGHNDEKDDPARHTDAATTFRANLRQYIAESRARGGVPVLLTPVSRRRFDGERVQPSHGAYPAATRAVAEETRTPLLDMTELTARLLERFGPSASAQLFAPDDNTHFSAEGAHAVAKLVIAGLRELGMALATREHAPSVSYFPGAGKSAVVICPGGGYTHLSVQKEGTRIAAWANRLGLHAFVLRYRLADVGHPAPLQDVRRAIDWVRRHASSWGVDADRIGVLGFSAGGHLAACASCLFENDAQRPDFAILSYPVITFEPPYAHAGSRRALLGISPSAELVQSLSLETRVSARTPPTFLWHTRDDASVPAQNSQMYADALQRAGVPHELHLYEAGPHGLGMNPDYEAGREWPKACAAWLASHGLLE